MRQSICPSCGMEALDTIALREAPAVMRDGTRHGSGIDVMIMLFECRHCLWQGSSSKLNCV